MNLAVLMALATPGADSGDGPDGPPTNASLFQYNGTYVGVQWTNGYSGAFSQIGTSASSGVEPTSVTASASGTTYETGTTGNIDVISGTAWWVRHFRNGQASAWVYAGTSG